MTCEELRQHALSLLSTWQSALGSEIHVDLGGSLISDTAILEGVDFVDVDYRFLVDDPETGATATITSIENVTGLEYNRTMTVADWPTGRSVAHIFEATVSIPGLDVPARLEGCLRNRRRVGWHHFYATVFSSVEIAKFMDEKRRLRHDKVAYKECKKAMLARCQERVLALNLLGPDVVGSEASST